MTSDGIQGFLVETRNYGATAAFWKSLGFEKVLETDHGSGHWSHPAGGPYVFIVEQHERELTTHPVLTVAGTEPFASGRAPEFAQPFTPTHWGVRQALIRDPDGRVVALEAPLSGDIAEGGRHG